VRTSLQPVFPFVVIAGLSLAAVAFAWAAALRRRRRERGAWRWAVPVLRTAAIGLLALILLNPVASEEVRRERPPREVQILFDRSGSMRLGRAASRYAGAVRMVGRAVRRLDVAGAWHAFAFDDALHEVKLGGRLALAGPDEGPSRTSLGTALFALMRRVEDRDVRHIVLLSDGRNHDRRILDQAVSAAARRGVPISVFAAAQHVDRQNVSVRHVHVPGIVKAGSTVTLDAELTALQPYDLPVAVTLRDPSGKGIAVHMIKLQEGSNRCRLTFQAGHADMTYRLTVAPLARELTESDNTCEFRIGVRDQKLRVLYMEGTVAKREEEPLHEVAYLPQALMSEGDVDVMVLVNDKQARRGGRFCHVKGFTADHQMILQHHLGYPTSREELFGYDLVICSDINKTLFTPEQLAWTVELVAERGGGFIMIGGNTAFDAGGWNNTVWEQLLPVDISEEEGLRVVGKRNVRFTDTPDGHPILRFSSDKYLNELILMSHPPFQGHHLIRRTKPGASTLCESEEGIPLIVVQQYGRGRTMAFTSDVTCSWGKFHKTWGPRWLSEEAKEYAAQHGLPLVEEPARRGPKALPLGNDYYARFWMNALRWLTENSLRRLGNDVLVSVDALSHRAGDSVPVQVELLGQDPAFKRVTVAVDLPGAQAVPLGFDAEKEVFAGELQLPVAIGPSHVDIAATVHDLQRNAESVTRKTLRIDKTWQELQDVTPDPALLARVARQTGGRVLSTADELRALLQDTLAPQEPDKAQFFVPLWDTPWLWAALVVCFGVEWLIRKMLRA